MHSTTSRSLALLLAGASILSSCVSPKHATAGLEAAAVPEAAASPEAAAAPEAVAFSGETIVAGKVQRLTRLAFLGAPESIIIGIDIAPDNATILSGDLSGAVSLWRIADSSRIDLVPPVEGFMLDKDGKPVEFGSLAVFADHEKFVTGDTLGDLRGWDLSGRRLFAFDLGDRIHSIALSPDGRFLAAGCVDRKLIVFDLVTGSPTADLGTDYEYVTNQAFSPDGTTLLATYERPGNVMKTWDTASWREIATLRQSDQRFDYHDVIYSHDSRQIVMTGTRLDIEFLDAVTGEERGSLKGHSRAPYQLAFSPDGSLLASAADDMTLRIWDLKTGQILRMFKAGDEIFSVAFSPDGSLLAFAVRGEGIRVLALRD